MSEAAAIAGMTQSTFSLFFKKNTGANIIDYSRKLRIGRACKLLSDTASRLPTSASALATLGCVDEISTDGVFGIPSLNRA
jgi:transcriptional regulator GlxA family with amidase domain